MKINAVPVSHRVLPVYVLHGGDRDEERHLPHRDDFDLYVLMNLCLPILVFGLACIAFCALRSINASGQVYKVVPRTFRLCG